MAKPRLPRAKAKALGADIAHKERFVGRNEPVGLAGIGQPFPWLNDNAKQAWVKLPSWIGGLCQ